MFCFFPGDIVLSFRHRPAGFSPGRATTNARLDEYHPEKTIRRRRSIVNWDDAALGLWRSDSVALRDDDEVQRIIARDLEGGKFYLNRAVAVVGKGKRVSYLGRSP